MECGGRCGELPLLLAQLITKEPHLFRDVAKKDRALITLQETTRLRKFVQEDRKGCYQRIRSSLIGLIFCSEEGGFPEGEIEKLFDLAVASDPVAQALDAKEKKLNRKVEEACAKLPIYTDVLAHQKGVGPQLSAPIISAVQDIGLFDTVGKFKAFCGLHILGDGSFPRQRRGRKCNWNPSARQAFYLMGDMFNKFPDGFWGQRLRENKAMYRGKHPQKILIEGIYQIRDGAKVFIPSGKKFELAPGTFTEDKKTGVYLVTHEGDKVSVRGKQDYTKAHIHKMGVWRTVSEFAEWLYFKWRTTEGYSARVPNIYPPEDEEAIKTAKAALAAKALPTEEKAAVKTAESLNADAPSAST